MHMFPFSLSLPFSQCTCQQFPFGVQAPSDICIKLPEESYQHGTYPLDRSGWSHVTWVEPRRGAATALPCHDSMDAGGQLPAIHKYFPHKYYVQGEPRGTRVPP